MNWDGRWQTGETQWDAGKPSPALTALLDNEQTRSLIPQHGQALVPGCGSGYDVIFLANKDRHVTGLDISPTCIELLSKSHTRSDHYQFMCGDFFNFDIPNGGYDLAYDYT
ncbi:hypothetical protein G6F56_013256 [Rhizopus delemar]|nr:hypothetical protein G6F56_013256 [Rhizopus delemar]